MFAKINNFNTESQDSIIKFQKNWNKVGAKNGSITWIVDPQNKREAMAWCDSMRAKAESHGLKWFWVQVEKPEAFVEKQKVVLPQIKQGRFTAKTVINKVYAIEGRVLVLARDEDQRQLIIKLNKEVEDFKFIQFVKEEVK